MTRALLMGASALMLSACGREVEPETVETEGDVPVEEVVVDEAPVPEIGSVYTHLDECEITAQDREGGGLERTCPGQGGYELTVRTADARDTLTIATAGDQSAEIDLTRLVAGGQFNSIGPVVEWRGPTPEEPRMLIVRLDIADPTDPMAAASYLGLIRLEGEPCIVARVPPGPGQTVAARKLADRPTLPDCLKAKNDEAASEDADA
ncbi:hypothetical protein [Sphingomicrobium clamense]|uniref:Lipoprotein n=1 Tax=Sphingomicrobium clamense TaxID=2851013 RepID=A0ABS6V907_9SPHN|nr:hypothetical protein [Sphingomicrobium sp. B8]MBW0145835.1 hypothetical protein [Sphingomicrobium sp. B8]